MKKIIDTHSHLYSNKFSKDQDEVIQRAQEVLEAVFLPNIDEASIGPMLELTQKAPGFFRPMMGLHPCSVGEDYHEVLEKFETYLRENREQYVGVGETGIDLYWDKSTFDRQKAALNIQIEWAKKYELPIILHARDAIDETLEIIEAAHDEKLSGIFHCFDGTIDQARRVMALGNFYIGIGGIVTYRKDVQAMVKEIDLDYLLLETDSPYLPPEPFRKSKNRRNESSYTRYVAEKIAELHSLSYDEVAELTNRNALRVFQLSASDILA
jgi:TatD DNase family protein